MVSHPHRHVAHRWSQKLRLSVSHCTEQVQSANRLAIYAIKTAASESMTLSCVKNFQWRDYQVGRSVLLSRSRSMTHISLRLAGTGGNQSASERQVDFGYCHLEVCAYV